MVDQDDLAVLLAEFARTMLTDFPIQRILDHLVLRIVEVLSVIGAGVTMIDPGGPPRYVAASGADAMRFEQLQSEVGEGPCLTAYTSGEAVAVPDLRADTRYPVFGPAALNAGLAAVFTFPLRHGEGRLGALDLYCDRVGSLDAREADMRHDRATAAIVAAVTDLAHALGRTVTAEGVETPAQRDQVVRLGCDLAQGFSAALPAAELSQHLAEGHGAALCLP